MFTLKQRYTTEKERCLPLLGNKCVNKIYLSSNNIPLYFYISVFPTYDFLEDKG